MAVSIKVDVGISSDEEAPAAWATMLGMTGTFTTTTGKLYLILLHGVCVTTSTDETGEWRFAVDGTPVTNGPIATAFIDAANEGQGFALAFVWEESSGASRTFTAEWQRVQVTPRTDTTRTRTFQVIELDDAALKLNLSSVASDTPTASYTDVVGLSGSFSTASGAIHLILATMPTSMGTDRSADFRFHVDTVAEGPEVSSWDDAALEGNSIQMSYVRTGLSAASHTFALRWKDRQGSPSADTGRRRTLQVLELTGNWNRRVNVESVSSDSPAAGFTTVDAMSAAFTPVNTSSVMLMFLNMNPDDSDGAADMFSDFRLAIAGVQAGAETMYGSDEADGVHGAHLAHAETGRSTSQAYSAEWRIRSGTATTDTGRPRTLQVLEWDDGGGAPATNRLLTIAPPGLDGGFGTGDLSL